MEDSRPVKRRKSGGSFCAVGGCSNNSHRNQTSAIQGRGFLKYLNIPKEEARISRQKDDEWIKKTFAVQKLCFRLEQGSSIR